MDLELLVDPDEKAAAQQQFKRQLEQQLGYYADETIGYQGGRGIYEVYSHGPGTLYYAYSPPKAKDKTPRHWNSFGVYGEKGVSGIGVEINVPSKENSGLVAGFFARDPNTGATYVMHDGGIRGGRKGVSKGPFLAWLGEDLDRAIAEETRRVGLRIAELGNPRLSDQIWQFVQKVDEFKKEATSGRLNTSAFKKKIVQSTAARNALLKSQIDSSEKHAPLSGDQLVEEAPPEASKGKSAKTRAFKATKRTYRSSDEFRELGLAGERLVFAREKQRLAAWGCHDLADRVRHVADVDGDGAGYDIASFFKDGRPKFIEVKTTTGPKTTAFLISANEVACSAEKRDQYELCRVFDFDPAQNRAKSYSVLGAIEVRFELVASQFSARIK